MTLIPPIGYSDSNPYMIRVDPNVMYSNMSPEVVPAMHSKHVEGFNLPQIYFICSL